MRHFWVTTWLLLGLLLLLPVLVPNKTAQLANPPDIVRYSVTLDPTQHTLISRITPNVVWLQPPSSELHWNLNANGSAWAKAPDQPIGLPHDRSHPFPPVVGPEYEFSDLAVFYSDGTTLHSRAMPTFGDLDLPVVRGPVGVVIVDPDNSPLSEHKGLVTLTLSSVGNPFHSQVTAVLDPKVNVVAATHSVLSTPLRPGWSNSTPLRTRLMNLEASSARLGTKPFDAVLVAWEVTNDPGGHGVDGGTGAYHLSAVPLGDRAFMSDGATLDGVTSPLTCFFATSAAAHGARGRATVTGDPPAGDVRLQALVGPNACRDIATGDSIGSRRYPAGTTINWADGIAYAAPDVQLADLLVIERPLDGSGTVYAVLHPAESITVQKPSRLGVTFLDWEDLADNSGGANLQIWVNSRHPLLVTVSAREHTRLIDGSFAIGSPYDDLIPGVEQHFSYAFHVSGGPDGEHYPQLMIVAQTAAGRGIHFLPSRPEETNSYSLVPVRREGYIFGVPDSSVRTRGATGLRRAW